MTEAISGDGAAVAPGGGFDDDDDNDSHLSRDSHSLDTLDEAPNLANNVRIKSRRFLRDNEVDDEVGKFRFMGLVRFYLPTCFKI